MNTCDVDTLKKFVDIAVSEMGLTSDDFEFWEGSGGFINCRPRSYLKMDERKNWTLRELVFGEMSRLGIDNDSSGRSSPICWKCWQVQGLQPWECPAPSYFMEDHDG